MVNQRNCAYWEKVCVLNIESYPRVRIEPLFHYVPSLSLPFVRLHFLSPPPYTSSFLNSFRCYFCSRPTSLHNAIAVRTALKSQVVQACVGKAGYSRGIRGVFEGYSGVFGSFSGYSVEVPSSRIWQVPHRRASTICPSDPFIILKGIYCYLKGPALPLRA